MCARINEANTEMARLVSIIEGRWRLSWVEGLHSHAHALKRCNTTHWLLLTHVRGHDMQSCQATVRIFFKSLTHDVASHSACCVNPAAGDVQFELNDLQSDASRAIWAVVAHSFFFFFPKKGLFAWSGGRIPFSVTITHQQSVVYPSQTFSLSPVYLMQYFTGLLWVKKPLKCEANVVLHRNKQISNVSSLGNCLLRQTRACKCGEDDMLDYKLTIRIVGGRGFQWLGNGCWFLIRVIHKLQLFNRLRDMFPKGASIWCAAAVWTQMSCSQEPKVRMGRLVEDPRKAK